MNEGMICTIEHFEMNSVPMGSDHEIAASRSITLLHSIPFEGVGTDTYQPLWQTPSDVPFFQDHGGCTPYKLQNLNNTKP